MNSPVTKKQRSILNFIVAYRGQTGYSPTIREIGTAFGLKNTNGAICHLRALQRKGLIKYERNRARSIIPIVERGEENTGFEKSVFDLLEGIHGVKELNGFQRNAISSHIHLIESYYRDCIKEEDDAGASKEVQSGISDRG